MSSSPSAPPGTLYNECLRNPFLGFETGIGSRASLVSEPFSFSTVLRRKTPSAMAPKAETVRSLPGSKGVLEGGGGCWRGGVGGCVRGGGLEGVC